MDRHRITAIAAATTVTVGLLGSAFALSGGGAQNEPAPVPSTTSVAPDPSAARPIAEQSRPGDLEESAETRAASGDEAADDATPAPTQTPAPGPSIPVHEVIPGEGTAPPSGPAGLIGELGDGTPVPAGFDFTAPPKAPGGTTTGLQGPGGLAAAPSCSHQCISSGRAYPRGFGVELVVETTVSAELFISAIADLDGDGDYEEKHFETTPHGITKHSWKLDNLEPGTTYHAMVAATDQHGHTSYAWGEFTTLSQRNVFVEFGDLTISGGPGNINRTLWYLGLDGPLTNVTPGDQGILLFKDVERVLDLDFWVTRRWECDLYEAWQADPAVPQGHWGSSCLAWNSTSLDVDLDTKPAGKTRWTSTTVQLTLEPPSGEGNALPPGYGDPYWFHFSVPVTLHVSYS